MRSCLYMPGSNARALEKARTLPADVVILDLEDAVAPDAKELARQQVCDAVKGGGFGSRLVVVRINAFDTPWGADDLAAVVAAGPDAILAPKVSSADEVEAYCAALGAAGADAALQFWAMIETPRSVLNLPDISAAGKGRLTTLVAGTNDLVKELFTELACDRSNVMHSLSHLLLCATANGLTALDGVCNQIEDLERLRTECGQGRSLGFDGKTLIHPAQIETANTAFSPDHEQLDQARAIVDAFANPENAGAGVIKVNGKMTELLHLEQARRLLAMQASIERLS